MEFGGPGVGAPRADSFDMLRLPGRLQAAELTSWKLRAKPCSENAAQSEGYHR